MVYHNNRRQFLKAAGSASVASGFGLAGCVGLREGEFPDQEIAFLEPYGAGSGFDAYARGLADVWEGYLDVDVVVENVTGAGGRTMVEQLYADDSNGYTVGILNIPGFAVAQEALDVSYDLSEMNHLGRVTRGTYNIYTAADRDDIETWEDLSEMDEVNFGMVGFGTSNSFVAILFLEEADINVNWVTGYNEAPDVRRAVVQHEVDVAQHTVSAAGAMLQEGDLKPIMTYAERDSLPDWYPDVPHTTPETERFDGWEDRLNISRIVSAPPDVDEDRVELLEETLWETFQSDELQEWADEADQALTEQVRGDEAAEIIDGSMEEFRPHMDLIEPHIE